MTDAKAGPRPTSLQARLKSLGLDWYIGAIVGMVVLASILPARGAAAPLVSDLTKAGIALVFFLHGAKLSQEAVIRGLLHWRLHGLVLATTFVLWPLLGLGAAGLPGWIVPAALAPGLVYLACLPSTIQSAIGFTAIGKGNVAAAVCGASVSNLLGMFITPLLFVGAIRLSRPHAPWARWRYTARPRKMHRALERERWLRRPVVQAKLFEVTALDATARGAGGFGSTGRI